MYEWRGSCEVFSLRFRWNIATGGPYYKEEDVQAILRFKEEEIS